MLLLLFTPLTACGDSDGRQLPVQDVVIETQAGDKHKFITELALTPDEMSVGLMFRKDMKDDHGMLFYFGAEREARFWMKNTFIPLDMLFIKSDGTIFYIHENAQPHDLNSIAPDGLASAVLEINAGLSKELGIKVGDKVQHTLFQAK